MFTCIAAHYDLCTFNLHTWQLTLLPFESVTVILLKSTFVYTYFTAPLSCTFLLWSYMSCTNTKSVKHRKCANVELGGVRK